MRIFQPAWSSETAFDDLIFASFGSHCRDFATFPIHLLKAKKMAPRLRGGPAVECYPFRLLQQGAGERIPVAVFKLLHRSDIVKPY
jgi:hypothetical protein